MMTERQSRVALVTGASSGIGREMARALSERGYAIVATGRNERELATLAGELAPRDVHPVVADLARPAGRRVIHDYLELHHLTVSVLVNNAGLGDLSPFIETNISRQLDMIQVNVAALVELTHDLAPQMAASGDGFILNVASTAGFAPGALMAVYYASKAFVVSFSLALSEELSRSGVRVCALCPGPTRTGFDRASGAAERKLGLGVMGARRVALAGLDGLFSGRRLVVPGLVNKLAVAATRLLPRSLLARSLFAFNEHKKKPLAR